MKKYVFIFLLIFMISCDDNVDLIPPRLTISYDTTATLSVISPIIVTVSGYANEDLVSFKFITQPYLFEYDTVFPTYTHNFTKEIEIKITDKYLENLTSDSLMTLKFEIKDGFNTVTDEKHIRITNAYPLYELSFSKLCYKKDSAFFYSFDFKQSLDFQQISNSVFDIVGLYDDSLGFILASADAFYISQKLNELAYIYDSSHRRHTSLQKLNVDFNDVTAKYLYYLTVGEQSIDDNGGNGTGVNDLKVGDVVAFKMNGDVKGVIGITGEDVTNKRMTFTVKIQQ